MVPQFIRGPSRVTEENEPLLYEIFRVRFFQFLRIQPRGESEGGSRDVPEPILSLYAVNGGTESHRLTESCPLCPSDLSMQLRHK